MNIKEKAKIFAINAHDGMVRKNEKDKPMIIHPIGVAKILEEYGFDDNVIAAGYLHDVVEDTNCTIDKIYGEFGRDIASLVMSASEEDKSLPWEERKTRTVEKIRNLPLRNKALICADKINNLEDIMTKFAKTGKRDFSSFNRGEEKQKWYYDNVYKSLIYNEDENLEIFKRVKRAIDVVFYNKDELELDDVFEDNLEYYEKLKKLHAKKRELQQLKKLCNLDKAFTVEFLGTPRTGKTTVINNIYDFFKKGSFDISLVEEFYNSKSYKGALQKDFDKLTREERNIKILELVTENIQKTLEEPNDIVLIDRGINDRQVWNYRLYSENGMRVNRYMNTRDKYVKLSKDMIDLLIITYADSLTSLKRDYNNTLALEKRSFLNIKNIESYNTALNSVRRLFDSSVDNNMLILSNGMTKEEIAINVADKMMEIMRKKYIDKFKEDCDKIKKKN